MHDSKLTRFPIIYLPIEHGNREFNAKLLLAHELFRRNFMVVIGQQWMIYQNLHSLPPGVILIKSFNRIHEAAMRASKKAGFTLVLQEEELLGHLDEEYIKDNIPIESLRYADMIFSNGTIEAKILKNMLPSSANFVYETGNARIDMVKKENSFIFKEDIDRIKEIHKEYILINTNFSITNSIWGSVDAVKNLQVRGGSLNLKSSSSVQKWEDGLDFETKNKEGILKVIKKLSVALPKKKIIIRPHPGESLNFWHTHLMHGDNLEVIRQGDHVPWTLASEILLHTSCTTGLEAFAAGKTAFSLVSNECWLSKSFISNKVNPTFDNPDELTDAVVGFINNGYEIKEKKSNLDVENIVFNIKSESAVDKMADLITRGNFKYDFDFPSMTQIERDPRLIEKFCMSFDDFSDKFSFVCDNKGFKKQGSVHHLGDSLFAVVPSETH